MDLISFIIPCYKSENTIKAVITEIIDKVTDMKEWDYEIIAVDDYSPDNVYSVLSDLASKNPKIRAIRFSKNFGQHAGLIAGLQHSIGDICVFLDDDGQCPVDQLDKLVAPLYNNWDVAVAQYGRKVQSLFKNFGSFVNEKSANILIDKPKNIQMGNFMAFKRYVANEISSYSGPYPYISGLLFRTSSKIINVPMKERGRISGNTTYTFRKLISLWMSSFTAFSIKPLRLATVMGSISAFIGIVWALIITIRKLFNPNIAIGWTSTIVVNLVLGGMILFMLGIIGEYVGRIYMSINGTPQYVILDSVNIDLNNIKLKSLKQ